MPDPKVSPEDVILRVLQEAGQQSSRRVYRTALVKLVYLVDYIYAQHTGQSLTGLEYTWDDYGPNAVGNEIVKRADALSFPAEKIDIEKGVTPFGNPKFLYRVRDGVERSSLTDQLGERIIQDVIAAYGNLNWADIVQAAKKTGPFLQAKPGDHLNLAPNASKQLRLAKLRAMLGEREYDTRRPTTPIRELKARYGLVGQ